MAHCIICLRLVGRAHLRRQRCQSCYAYLRRHGVDRATVEGEVARLGTIPDRRWQNLGHDEGTDSMTFEEWCRASGWTPGARRYAGV